MITVSQIIARVEQIAAEEPGYGLGQDGQNGLCDNAGLIVGAIRRAGGQWRGPLESNYAARMEIAAVEKISPDCLQTGEVVFRAYEPWQGGYSLAKEYEKHGDYYTGDLTDYYHIGIVESVSPIRIRHMAFGRMKMDTRLEKWTYHGKLKRVDYGGQEEPKYCKPPEIKKQDDTVSVPRAELEKLYNLLSEILEIRTE